MLVLVIVKDIKNQKQKRQYAGDSDVQFATKVMRIDQNAITPSPMKIIG